MSNSNVIIVEEIDGIEIVKGIDKLTIDAVATRKIVQVEIINTPEFIACKVKQDEMNDLFAQAGEKLKQSSNATMQRNTPSANKFHREYRQLYNDALDIMNEVKSLLPAVKKVERELFTTHAVYFEPGRNERLKSEFELSDIQSKINSLQSNKLIRSDGTLIDNFKGMTFYHKMADKWNEININKIGDGKPVQGKAFDELSDIEIHEVKHDRNVYRISLLSAIEKENEKQFELKKVLTSAAIRRSEFEILNDPDALAKSQQWYNAEVAKIEELYK